MIKIGFTGTQIGMTWNQKVGFVELITKLTDKKAENFPELEFHHGDCIGADKDANEILKVNWTVYNVCHPPINSSKRAFCEYTEKRQAKPYLERNKDIVRESDYLIATPKEFCEELRSGTWATIRHARKLGKGIAIIFPDGSIEFNQYWNQ